MSVNTTAIIAVLMPRAATFQEVTRVPASPATVAMDSCALTSTSVKTIATTAVLKVLRAATLQADTSVVVC